MATADEVIVEFEARVGQYESDLKRSAATFERVTGQQQKQILALERQIRSSSSNIGSSLKGLAGTIAAAFSAQQVAGFVDSWTRYNNQLKVAGYEGAQLVDVQTQLLDIANKYGVSLEAVGTLFGRNSAAAKEMNLTQGQQLRIVEATSAALKVSGESSEEAAGALLQLSQALGGTMIQAEEYNSLIDGARPLLQAVAAGSDKWGGSVAKLTSDVKAGKVSVQEFVAALLKGSDTVIKQAADSTLTLSGAFTVLENNLTKFIGTAGQSSGATSIISDGIVTLSQNIGTLAEALSVIAVALGTRYVAAAGVSVLASVAASDAFFAMTAVVGGAATATEGLSFALAGLAGAGAVVTGIAAIAGGIAYLYIKEKEAEAASADLTASIDQQASSFAAAHKQAALVAARTGELTKGQREAQVATANLTGEANLLADAWARVAVEAKQAAIANAQAALSKATTNRTEAQAAVNTQNAIEQNRPSNQASGSPQGTIGRGLNSLFNAIGLTDSAKIAKKAQDNQKRLDVAVQNEADARTALADTLKASLKDFRQDPAAADPNSANAKALAKHQATLADLEKLKVGASGKDLATINKKIAREQAIIGNLQKGVGETAALAAATGSAANHAEKIDHSEQDLSRLREEELRARLDLATNAEDRADIQKQILDEERSARIAEVNANKDYDAAQKKAALAAIDRLYGPASKPGELVVSPSLYGTRVDREKDQQLERDKLDQSQAVYDVQREILQNQHDLARSSAMRRDIALKLIDLEYDQQKAALEATIASKTATDAEKKRAQLSLNALGEITNGRREIATQDNESPLQAYKRKLDKSGGEVNDEVEGYVVDELDSFRDSIRSGIEKMIGTKDPLISGLLNMLLEQVLIRPITDALSDAGSGSGNFFGNLARGIGSLFGGGRATGGPVTAGRVYKVGESGAELFRPQQNGVIIPNHSLKGQSGSAVIQQTFVLDNRGGITTPELIDYINQTANTKAVQASAAMGKQVYQAIPTRLSSYQRDGV